MLSSFPTTMHLCTSSSYWKSLVLRTGGGPSLSNALSVNYRTYQTIKGLVSVLQLSIQISCATLVGELEQTMSKGFYLGSRLRRFAHSNQFGARSEELKEEVKELMEEVDHAIGSHIKGTLITDVFHTFEQGENNSDLVGEFMSLSNGSRSMLSTRSRSPSYSIQFDHRKRKETIGRQVQWRHAEYSFVLPQQQQYLPPSR
jgi:hypothetical protein